MITNQNMIRGMGNFEVVQRTKDGFFNATELLKQWNKFYNSDKRIQSYFENTSTASFINALISEEKLNSKKSCYLTTRGKNGGTWMHPLLFIDFAMWLNPAFKVKVLKFVYDKMIQYRNDAGDAYRELGSAVNRIVPKDFMPKAMKKIGEALNWIIFNSHERELRNKHGNEAKMRELYEFEHKISSLVNEGFITNYTDLMNYLRRQYSTRNNPISLV